VFASDASARISPVLTSITTATPDTASVAANCRARSRSATNCNEVSRVNSRPTPGWALRMTVLNELGRLTPEEDTNSRVTPVLPASNFWYWYSSPAEPAPAAFVPRGLTSRWAHSDTCAPMSSARRSRKVQRGDLATGVQIQLVVQDDIAVLRLGKKGTSRFTGTWMSADIACASRWGCVICMSSAMTNEVGRDTARICPCRS